MYFDTLIITEEEKIDILYEANDMLRGLYRFNGTWDMEPCSVPVDNHRIRWDICYNGDPEWSYMFTRMDYLYKLIIASEITNDSKYVYHGLKIIKKWFKDNRKFLYKNLGKVNSIIVKKNHLGHRTLDVSIMMSNIIDYVLYCEKEKIINAKELIKYKNQVNKVINYVYSSRNRPEKAFSNWGIIENGNLIYCLKRLESHKRYEKIKNILIRQVYNQINTNGSQIESSPMYLVQILLVLLKVLRISDDMYDSLYLPVSKGCNYIKDIVKPDNCIPNIGDSDLTDISDLMSIASQVLDDKSYLKYARKNLNLEYCFKYDLKRKTNELPDNNSQENKIICYSDQTVCKLSSDRSYLLCLNIPRKVDAHKHYDYLSVIYSTYEKDLLVDLGRFSYMNNETRWFYQGKPSHNTVSIDSQEFFEVVSSWVLKQCIKCNDNRVTEDNRFITTKMSCDFGYSGLSISRYVTYVYSVGLIITDIVNKDNQKTETYFNIGDEWNLEIHENNIRIHDGTNNVYYWNDKKIEVDVVKVPYSKKYNEKVETNQLRLKTNQRRVSHFFLYNDINIKTVYSDETIEYMIGNLNFIINIPI